MEKHVEKHMEKHSVQDVVREHDAAHEVHEKHGDDAPGEERPGHPDGVDDHPQLTNKSENLDKPYDADETDEADDTDHIERGEHTLEDNFEDLQKDHHGIKVVPEQQGIIVMACWSEQR